MDDIAFALASPSDTLDITSLLELAYRSPETAGRWDSESHLLRGPRTSPEEIEALLTSKNARFVLASAPAQAPERIIGCALVQLHTENSKEHRASFGMFATHPQTRNIGLGHKVLQAAERYAQNEWGIVEMSLSVISLRTTLIAWYERRGYRLTGRRHPFPFSSTTGETRRDFDLVEMTRRLADTVAIQ